MVRHHNVDVGNHLPVYHIRRGEVSASGYFALDELERPLILSFAHLILYLSAMARHIKYPDRGIPRVQVEKIENLATMNEKPDTVTHSSDEALEEGSVETAHTSFEEKINVEKKLVRKIDLYLMPTIWILYCFSYMVCRSDYSQKNPYITD
jgi:hypothetical protein